MSLLADLNDPQRRAVMATDGPVLVLAGAGSGKTRVIVHRIAWLIEEMGIPPEQVLAVTFTNKAAEEMRQRVRSLLHRSSGAPWVSTFHSLCVRLLRRDGPATGISRDFTIYDDDDQLSVVKAQMRALGLDDSWMQPRAVLSRISHAKNRGFFPEDVFASAATTDGEMLAQVFDRYQAALRKSNSLDFDDLLLEAVRLLRQSPETAAKYNSRFRYLMVDEYQDTNRSQYELVVLLSQAHHNVCVVGDEDQSIYSWRGADIRNILEFERDFPEAQTIRLEQNYRSTRNILAAAGAVVANNTARKGKTLWTENSPGAGVGFYAAEDGENEALFVADWISRHSRDNPSSRLAVLYRTNAQSRQMEEAMRRYGIRYHVVGGFSFYERAEIKDLLSYLKFVRNPDDSLSLLRIINTPPRGIGKGTLEQIERYALENNLALWPAIASILADGALPQRAASALSPFRRLAEDLVALAQAETSTPDLLRAVIDRTAFRQAFEKEATPEALDRLENIQEMLNAAQDSAERGENLADFLDHSALVSDADQYDERAPVTLMTLHSAKGLEFSVVFISGMEEGTFPHNRALGKPAAGAGHGLQGPGEAGIEEERRLCYVGMTRAREQLILTRARFRRRYGDEMQQRTVPSRFLDEVPAELLEDLGGPAGRRKAAGAPAYGGQVYNSLENIQSFFAARGIPAPAKPAPRQPGGPPVDAQASQSGIRMGQRVRHAKFGVGTVVRSEGEGGDAKLTISFPGYGLKKMVARYAGLRRE